MYPSNLPNSFGNGLHCLRIADRASDLQRLRTIPSSCIRLRTFFAL